MWVFIIGCIVGNVATVLSYKMSTYVQDNYSTKIGKYAYLAIKKYVEFQQLPCVKFISEKYHIPVSGCKTLTSEPVEDEWIATYWITDKGTLQYNYVEYKDSSRLLSDTDKRVEPVDCYKLYKYKKNNYYQMSMSDTFDLTIPLSPAGYKFISVEYNSTLLTEPILLTIPSAEMVIGSYICTPAHVLLLLQRQHPCDNVFANDYTIYVIDHQLVLHTLTSDSAILLTETSAIPIQMHPTITSST